MEVEAVVSVPSSSSNPDDGFTCEILGAEQRKEGAQQLAVHPPVDYYILIIGLAHSVVTCYIIATTHFNAYFMINRQTCRQPL